MPLPTIPFPHVLTTIFDEVVGFCVATDTGLIVTMIFGFDEVGLRVIEAFNVGFTDDGLDGMDVLGFDDVGFIVGLDNGDGGVVGVVLRQGPF